VILGINGAPVVGGFQHRTEQGKPRPDGGHERLDFHEFAMVGDGQTPSRHFQAAELLGDSRYAGTCARSLDLAIGLNVASMATQNMTHAEIRKAILEHVERSLRVVAGTDHPFHDSEVMLAEIGTRVRAGSARVKVLEGEPPVSDAEANAAVDALETNSNAREVAG
jgi:hypothetical protein